MEQGLSAKRSHGSRSQTEPEEEVLEQDTGWDHAWGSPCSSQVTGAGAEDPWTQPWRETCPLSLRVRNTLVVLPTVWFCGNSSPAHIEPSSLFFLPSLDFQLSIDSILSPPPYPHPAIFLLRWFWKTNSSTAFKK